MNGVDIVAGTSTTLLYQLLPYGRPTWIFDTDYSYADDLVEQGPAHLVRYEDLNTLDDGYFSENSSERRILAQFRDIDGDFGEVCLEGVLGSRANRNSD